MGFRQAGAVFGCYLGCFVIRWCYSLLSRRELGHSHEPTRSCWLKLESYRWSLFRFYTSEGVSSCRRKFLGVVDALPFSGEAGLDLGSSLSLGSVVVVTTTYPEAALIDGLRASLWLSCCSGLSQTAGCSPSITETGCCVERAAAGISCVTP